MKRIDFETKLGGIFGIIALIAIIYEASLGGFTPEVTAAAVKDIAGTLVAVLVLVVAVRKIRPGKSKETFQSVLHLMYLIHHSSFYLKFITKAIIIFLLCLVCQWNNTPHRLFAYLQFYKYSFRHKQVGSSLIFCIHLV
jgi:hypothetical protein